jgi:hypothetical protein
MAGMRGKGGRRGPWRDGGHNRQSGEDWGKQARHAVEDKCRLSEPIVTLDYSREVTDKPSPMIYKFDQQAAKAGLAYYAEYQGYGRFEISVSGEERDVAQKCIVKA